MLDKNAWAGVVPFIPRYTTLDAVAAMETPLQIEDWESSDEFTSLCEQQARNLIATIGKNTSAPSLFHSALLPDNQGIIAVQSRVPPIHRCAVFFSSPLRAAAYADLLLGGLKLTPIEFTASMFAETLKELNKSGIRHFVLDRCPRCWSFPVTNGATIPTADAATANWAFVKAVEMTRADYYLQVARHRAAAGDWAASRDICLLAVAHVTPEDSRFHVHLASVAEKLQDEVMLMEAKEAVRHLHRPLFRLSPFRTDIDLNFFDSAVEI